MIKNELRFNHMHTRDYFAFFPGFVLAGFAVYFFVLGLHHTVPQVGFVLAAGSLLVFGFMIYAAGISFHLTASGIEQKNKFGKGKSIRWDEVNSVLVYKDKSTITIFLSEAVLTDMPTKKTIQGKKILSFSYRQSAIIFIRQMIGHRVIIKVKRKGFNLLDLTDLVDLFR